MNPLTVWPQLTVYLKPYLSRVDGMLSSAMLGECLCVYLSIIECNLTACCTRSTAIACVRSYFT